MNQLCSIHSIHSAIGRIINGIQFHSFRKHTVSLRTRLPSVKCKHQGLFYPSVLNIKLQHLLSYPHTFLMALVKIIYDISLLISPLFSKGKVYTSRDWASQKSHQDQHLSPVSFNMKEKNLVIFSQSRICQLALDSKRVKRLNNMCFYF